MTGVVYRVFSFFQGEVLSNTEFFISIPAKFPFLEFLRLLWRYSIFLQSTQFNTYFH
jgi:hypothetical protein